MSIGRLLSLLVRPLLALLLVFATFHLLPGSPLMAESNFKAPYQEFLRQKFQLEEPIFLQAVNFFKSLLTWDWGASLSEYPRAATELIASAYSASALLSLTAFLVVTLASAFLSIGFILWQGGRFLGGWQRGLKFLQGLPVLFLGPLLIYIFSIRLKLLPVALLESPAAYFLPVLCLSLRPIVLTCRLLTTELSRHMSDDFVQLARAKGLSQFEVVTKHAFKVSLPLFFTSLFNSAVSLIGGSILVEVLFGINGIGSLLLRSLEHRDAPVVFAITALYCGLYFILSLVYELALHWADPRVQEHEGSLK